MSDKFLCFDCDDMHISPTDNKRKPTTLDNVIQFVDGRFYNDIDKNKSHHHIMNNISFPQQYIWRLPELTLTTARLLLDGYLEIERLKFDIPFDIINLWMHYFIDIDIVNKIKNAKRLQCFKSNIFCMKGFKFYIELANNDTSKPIHSHFYHSRTPSFVLKDLFHSDNDQNTDDQSTDDQNTDNPHIDDELDDDDDDDDDDNDEDEDDDEKEKDDEEENYVYNDYPADVEENDYFAITAFYGMEDSETFLNSRSSLFGDYGRLTLKSRTQTMEASSNDNMSNDNMSDVSKSLIITKKSINTSPQNKIIETAEIPNNNNIEFAHFSDIKLDEKDEMNHNILSNNTSNIFAESSLSIPEPSTISQLNQVDYYSMTAYYGMDDDIFDWGHDQQNHSELDLYVHIISISPNISNINVKCDIILFEKDIKIYTDCNLNNTLTWFRWHDGMGWNNRKRLKLDEIQHLETLTFQVTMNELNITLKNNDIDEWMIESYLPSQKPNLSMSIGYYIWEIDNYLIIENIKQNKSKQQSDIFFMDSIFPWNLQFDATDLGLRLSLKWFPCNILCIYVLYKLVFNEANINFEGYYKFDANNLISHTWNHTITRGLDLDRFNKFTFSVEIQLIDAYDKNGKALDRNLVFNKQTNITSDVQQLNEMNIIGMDEQDEIEYIEKDENDISNNMNLMRVTDLINVHSINYQLITKHSKSIKHIQRRNMKKRSERYWFNKSTSNRHRHNATKHLYDRW